MITKGKWRISEGDLRSNGRGEFIEILTNDKFIAMIEGKEFEGVTDEDRANARLIASSKPLLEACKAFVIKLKQVEKDSFYVYEFAQNHQMRYKGATYEKELKQIKQAIKEAGE